MSQSGARAGQDLAALAAQQHEIEKAKRQAEYGLRFECHQRAVNATTTMFKGVDGQGDMLQPAPIDVQMDYAQELFDWVTQTESD